MDLTKAILPDSVEVSGRFYKIHTGHPYWFRFHSLFSQDVKYVDDFDFLYVDEIPQDKQGGVSALLAFFYEKKEVPRGDSDGELVLDYDIDSDLIYAGILQCYGVDLFEREIHWHKVRAMISGLRETKLNDIIYYRCSNPGKNRELAKAKAAWALPVKVDAQSEERMKSFSDQFYGAQF